MEFSLLANDPRALWLSSVFVKIEIKWLYLAIRQDIAIFLLTYINLAKECE